MVDLDIDIWGYGRDARRASQISEAAMLAAGYPNIKCDSEASLNKLRGIAAGNLERNHNDQRTWLTQGDHIFFQSIEDRDFCLALLYIY